MRTSPQHVTIDVMGCSTELTEIEISVLIYALDKLSVTALSDEEYEGLAHLKAILK